MLKWCGSGSAVERSCDSPMLARRPVYINGYSLALKRRGYRSHPAFSLNSAIWTVYLINTFGDGVGTTNAQTRENVNCALITGRDGAATQSDDPLSYHDINVRDDLCGGVPQMAPFCPMLDGEDGSSGLGITNIVPVDDQTGAATLVPKDAVAVFILRYHPSRRYYQVY